jgi:hypothetical protein
MVYYSRKQSIVQEVEARRKWMWMGECFIAVYVLELLW